MRSKLIKDKKNKPLYLQGTFQDISKEKEVDQTKSDFISLASHQLRTPLSTISWYSEMLLDGDAGKITDEQRKFIQEAYDGSKRMTKLVSALLNVSRIETGTYMVQPEKVDVIKTLRGVLDENKPQCDEKKLTITLKKGAIPEMMLDPNLMVIIFQNLLTNAIKYTKEKGHIEVTLAIKKKGQQQGNITIPKDSLLISIKDNGMGIPVQQQPQIFQKLFRADNVRKANTDGNGLGLYLVKSLIEHSHGRIWFESKESKGTTFHVELPLSGMVKKEGTRKIDQ